jgi:hypothetical protein
MMFRSDRDDDGVNAIHASNEGDTAFPQTATSYSGTIVRLHQKRTSAG